MPAALFVVSEDGYCSGVCDDLQTPLWGEECIESLTTLDSAGVDVTGFPNAWEEGSSTTGA